jgi:hypothetical protein
MAMIFMLLYFLAITDGAFCGYRAAAGRSALIFKRTYYIKAMSRGAIWAHVAVMIAGLMAGVLLLRSSSYTELLTIFTQAGKYTLQVYLAYAAVISIAFAFRTINSVDIRSLTSTLIFGPFTLLRPIVAITGAMWALFKVPRLEIAIMVAVVLPMMLSMEWFLRHRYYHWESKSAA